MFASLGLAVLLASEGGDAATRDAFVQALTSLDADIGARKLDERADRLAQLQGATEAWLGIEAAGAAGADSGPLTSLQVDLLERVAAKLSRESVIEGIRASLDANADRGWRAGAFRLLDGRATSEDLVLLVDLVRASDHGIAPEDPLVTDLESTLAVVARRDLRLLGMSPWFAENAPVLQPTFLRALGESGEPEALPHLARALENRDLALVAIRQIARLAGKAAPGFRADLATRVRPFLEWSDEATRRHAIRALVALGDEESVPALLKIVENETASRHEAEFAALGELTGRNFPPDAPRWRRWYDEDRRWVESEGTATIERLSAKDDARVVDAMRELASHGLARDRSAEAVARVLRDHTSPAVRNQACLALAQLRSKAAMETLIDALADQDTLVAGSAWTALRRISGLSLPMSAKAWRDALRTGV
jgi:HEAT repeat protein